MGLKVSFSTTQRNCLRKVIKRAIKAAKKNSRTSPWIHAAYFPIQMKGVLNEEQTIKLLYRWKEEGYINWNDVLESTTKIKVEKEAEFIENFDSCQS